MFPNPIDFSRRLLNLISDPMFIRYTNISSEPNFFSIVGRTHFERWHSCFIGWLLDPNGSHFLYDYALKRFLLLLLDDSCLKSNEILLSSVIELLPTVEFSKLVVIPNELTSSEVHINQVGRFDIFVTGILKREGYGSQKINIIFELKIDSTVRSEQSKRYADWLTRTHPNDLNFLIYLLPNLLSSSKATVGDARWFCLDYQTLHDRLFLPILEHPDLNEKVKPFIIQYTRNMSKRYRGIKMAITNEEKQLAIALYEKYKDVFDSIFDTLQAANVMEESISGQETRGRSYGKLAVRVDGSLMIGEDVKGLFAKVLEYLVDNRLIDDIQLPWGTGTKRYILTNSEPAIHPNGRDFFIPIRYADFTMESHYSRKRAVKILDDLCKYLDLDFELVEA